MKRNHSPVEVEVLRMVVDGTPITMPEHVAARQSLVSCGLLMERKDGWHVAMPEGLAILLDTVPSISKSVSKK